MSKSLGRLASLKRDEENAEKKKARVAKKKASNDVEKARGLQRSGTSSKKGTYNASTKKWSLKK